MMTQTSYGTDCGKMSSSHINSVMYDNFIILHSSMCNILHIIWTGVLNKIIYGSTMKKSTAITKSISSIENGKFIQQLFLCCTCMYIYFIFSFGEKNHSDDEGNFISYL